MRRICLIVLASLFVAASSSIASITLAAGGDVQEPPTVCQDKAGRLKQGQIDVVVLMDNSGSLEAKNQTPTDPNRLRFSALDDFVDNYARLTSEGKNFGLIKFSTSAEVVIPLGPISSGSTEAIKSEIRNQLGEPTGSTDYIKAFDAAKRVFEGRPNENCKILIWFTDGEYDTLSGEDNKDDSLVAGDLRKLESNFCGNEGLSRFVQIEDINTFVVFLGSGIDTSGDRRTRRLEASIDVMQVITGDETPSIPSSTPRSVVSEKCSEQISSGVRHLGEVVSASEASDLLGYLTDLVNIADGGKPVLEGECPVGTSDLETLPLPSGQLIDWVSITGWDEDSTVGDSDSLASSLRVRVGSQESDVDDFFSLSSTSSGNVQRFLVKSESASNLTPGWRLIGKDLGRVCIRVKPQDLKFRISANELSAVSPLLSTDLFDGRMSLFIGDELVTVAEAASRGEVVTGVLAVENGQIFGAESTLPASIEVSELPILLPERCRLEVLGTREASDEVIASTECQVFPSPTFNVKIDASSLLDGLASCGLGLWVTTVNGAQSEVIAPGDQPVRVGVASKQGPGNQKDECQLGQQFVELQMSDASSSMLSAPRIESLVDFDLIKKANPLVALVLAAIATFIVSLLSLLLLRVVNDQLSKTVRSQDYFGYETDVDIVVSESGRGELRIDNQTARSFMGDIDNLQTIDGNKKQTSIRFGSVDLQRQLPGFFRPFEESRLRLKSQSLAVFWKSNRASDGLQMTFSSAAILATQRNAVPASASASPLRARLSLLVPKRGFDSGIAGVERLVKERGDDLASELIRELSHLEKDGPKDRAANQAIPSEHQPVVNEATKPTSPPFGRPPLGGGVRGGSSTDASSAPPAVPQRKSQPPGPPGPPKRPN